MTLLLSIVLFLFATLGLALDTASSARSAVQAKTTSPTSTQETQTSSSSSARAIQTKVIKVGEADHKFEPNLLQAEIGDIIEFHFYPLNHSVVRADYTKPCVPIEMLNTNVTGFFSGFNAVAQILPNPPSYRVRVNDSNPIFFYCSAPGSCIGYGMVGVINPRPDTLLTDFRARAQKAAFSLSPGEGFPAEGEAPGSSSSPSPAVPSSTSSTSSPPPKHNALAPGAIAGVVVGALAVIALAASLFFFIGRSRTLKQEMQRKDSTIRHVNPPSPSPMLQNAGGRIPSAYFDSPKYGEYPSPYSQVISSPVGGGNGVEESPVLGRNRSLGVARGGGIGVGYAGTGPNELDSTVSPKGLGFAGLDYDMKEENPFAQEEYPYWRNEGAPAEMDGRGLSVRFEGGRL